MSRHQLIAKDIANISLIPAIVNVSLLEKPLTCDFFARASNLVLLTLNDNHSSVLSSTVCDAIPQISYFRSTLTSEVNYNYSYIKL